MRRDFIVTPQAGQPVVGEVEVPGDKSISHRAILLAALGEGRKVLRGMLRSEDCMNTLAAIQALGVSVVDDADSVSIEGRGFCGLQAPAVAIDCGNSGTGMRLLAGVLCTQPFDSVLTGDESLNRRPMRRIADPLNAAGAKIGTEPGGTPPLRIAGGQKFRDIAYGLPVASAQVKSALLLAALTAGVSAKITEPDVSRDHTERMLAAYGVKIRQQQSGERRIITMQPAERLEVPNEISIPRDLSSAAFHLVLAALLPGSHVSLRKVGVSPSRDGVLRILARMGTAVSRENTSDDGEPQADLASRHAALKAVDIDARDVALAVDEIPILLIAAACADGTTRLRGAAELRVKESDRLAAMAAGLKALGITVAEYPDGLDVTGGAFAGGEVDSCGDHRIAMAFAVAGAVAEGPVRIRNVANVATSYPGFRSDLASLGVKIEEVGIEEIGVDE